MITFCAHDPPISIELVFYIENADNYVNKIETCNLFAKYIPLVEIDRHFDCMRERVYRRK